VFFISAQAEKNSEITAAIAWVVDRIVMAG
jgi:hypothetical protein